MQKHVLELPARMENMEKIIAFIEEHTGNIGSPKAAHQLLLAGEELALNVFSYAYDGVPGSFMMSICTDYEHRKVVMEFRDRGKPYNPLDNHDPDITQPISDRKMGGLGIMLSKKVTDKQAYSYDNGYNVLTIEKRY